MYTGIYLFLTILKLCNLFLNKIHPFNLRIGLNNSIDVQLVFCLDINQKFSNKKVNDGNFMIFKKTFYIKKT